MKIWFFHRVNMKSTLIKSVEARKQKQKVIIILNKKEKYIVEDKKTKYCMYYIKIEEEIYFVIDRKSERFKFDNEQDYICIGNKNK